MGINVHLGEYRIRCTMERGRWCCLGSLSHQRTHTYMRVPPEDRTIILLPRCAQGHTHRYTKVKPEEGAEQRRSKWGDIPVAHNSFLLWSPQGVLGVLDVNHTQRVFSPKWKQKPQKANLPMQSLCLAQHREEGLVKGWHLVEDHGPGTLRGPHCTGMSFAFHINTH